MGFCPDKPELEIAKSTVNKYLCCVLLFLLSVLFLFSGCFTGGYKVHISGCIQVWEFMEELLLKRVLTVSMNEN